MQSREQPSLNDREAFSKAVQTQLTRLLASELFRSSARHQLLLKTIVEESLAGRVDSLKEIVLAKDVFGRHDYDPKRHTLVRVQVNAIRSKLAEYYSKAEAEDRIHIDIPVGHYVAAFSSLPPVKPGPRPSRRWRLFAAIAGAAVSVLVALWAMSHASKVRAIVPVQVTFDTGWTSQPAVSRNGSVMVYASDRGPRGYSDIWIQDSGKAPRQLTNDASHDITPDISPDGTQVVYRSWRKPAGVYLIPARGGEPRLLAEGAYSPRFSPDGKWIAYAGMEEATHIFIVHTAGGAPERLDFGTTEAACPVWSPDSSVLVFNAFSSVGHEGDLWTANLHASRHQPSHPLGINRKLRAQNLPGVDIGDCPQDWIDDRLLFVTSSRNYLFQTSLKSAGAAGDIRAVPSAVGAAAVRALRDPNGRLSLLFGIEQRQVNLWGAKLPDSTSLQQLTRDDSLIPGFRGTWPSLSGDGNVLAYISQRSGTLAICRKDIPSNTDRLLSAKPSLGSPLLLDRNGSRIVYSDQHGSVMLRNTVNKTDRLLTNACPVLHDWSPDRNRLLCSEANDLFQMDLNGGGRTPLLHLDRPPVKARFSPDGQWVSFTTEAGDGDAAWGFVAPLDGSNSRIQICQEVYSLSLQWAPDGNAVYYWSTRDGFRCLYSQPLEPQSKVPLGKSFAVLHRHGLQHYPWAGGTLAVSSSRVATTLVDELANIWKIEWAP